MPDNTDIEEFYLVKFSCDELNDGEMIVACGTVTSITVALEAAIEWLKRTQLTAPIVTSITTHNIEGILINNANPQRP